MLTFPVAVSINDKVKCIPHIEQDDLFKINAVYVGTDRAYSGFEIYADMETGKLYAVDP